MKHARHLIARNAALTAALALLALLAHRGPAPTRYPDPELLHLRSAPVAAVATYQYDGTGPDVALQATWSSLRTAAPWMVTLHGGSWRYGSTANMAAAATLFYSRGWQVFNVAYPMGDTVTGQQQLDALTAAHDWIVAHAAAFHIDPARGTAFGFSAGGHLAAESGIRDHYANVVSIAGVLQPHRTWLDGHTDGASAFAVYLANRTQTMTGCAWPGWADTSECGRSWHTWMPETQLTAASPPMYVAQGEDDTAVSPLTAPAFAYHLGQAHVPYRLVMVPGYGHTSLCILGDATRTTAMLQWIVASERAA